MFRLTEGEIRRYDPISLDRFEEAARGWDWVEFRRHVRVRIEQALKGALRGGGFTLPEIRRRFGAWSLGGGDAFGVAYWIVGMSPYPAISKVILLEAIEDLAGFDVTTVTKCEVCGAFTIRQRAKEKQYCSSACRWQAITEQRRAERAKRSAKGSKPNPQSSLERKGAAHEHNRKA